MNDRLTMLQTRYTLASIPPPGYLCHDCAKELGLDPFASKKVGRKRRKIGEGGGKRDVVNFEEVERVKALAGMCIDVSYPLLSFTYFLLPTTTISTILPTNTPRR